MIKLIVGLGNPGLQYERTRHNAGFLFLDSMVEQTGGRWSSAAHFQAEMSNIQIGGNKLVLLKPMTFMNRSGLSVGKVLRYFKLATDELMVVHDELDLPEGVVKLKRDGGHAGHNGIRDVIAHVGTKDFYRLRIGIGRPPVGANVADYVLSGLSLRAIDNMDELFRSVTGHIQCALEGDVAAFNGLLCR